MVKKSKHLMRVIFLSLTSCLFMANCFARRSEGANVVYKPVRVYTDEILQRVTRMEKQGWEFISAFRVIEIGPGADSRRIIVVARESWELTSLSLSPGGEYFELLFKLTIYP